MTTLGGCGGEATAVMLVVVATMLAMASASCMVSTRPEQLGTENALSGGGRGCTMTPDAIINISGIASIMNGMCSLYSIYNIIMSTFKKYIIILTARGFDRCAVVHRTRSARAAARGRVLYSARAAMVRRYHIKVRGLDPPEHQLIRLCTWLKFTLKYHAWFQM